MSILLIVKQVFKKYLVIFQNIHFSQNGGMEESLSSPQETLDISICDNSILSNRDIQSTINGLRTIPQSPKLLVPEICVKTGHKFSNLHPMLGYCEQCSVRVFVGMLNNL